tara:strand:- start:4276 stop:4449 length:174 start_codon:yes stop_codon:yes gene_type:complete
VLGLVLVFDGVGTYRISPAAPALGVGKRFLGGGDGGETFLLPLLPFILGGSNGRFGI